MPLVVVDVLIDEPVVVSGAPKGEGYPDCIAAVAPYLPTLSLASLGDIGFPTTVRPSFYPLGYTEGIPTIKGRFGTTVAYGNVLVVVEVGRFPNDKGCVGVVNGCRGMYSVITVSGTVVGSVVVEMPPSDKICFSGGWGRQNNDDWRKDECLVRPVGADRVGCRYPGVVDGGRCQSTGDFAEQIARQGVADGDCVVPCGGIGLAVLIAPMKSEGDGGSSRSCKGAV